MLHNSQLWCRGEKGNFVREQVSFSAANEKKCLKDKMAQKKWEVQKTHLPDPANGFASFVFL